MSGHTYEATHDRKVKRWLNKLDAENKEHKPFREAAKKALNIFERGKDSKVAFPIYTANVNILHAALFSKLPDADVRRPHQDQGDKTLAKAVERAIEHVKDVEDYSLPAHRMVDEFLAAGMGVGYLAYEPTVVEVPLFDEFGEPLRDETGKPITEPQIESQTITLNYHPYHRFRWEPVVDWADCDWISFDFVKTAEQIEADYGVKLNNLPGKKKDGIKSANSCDKEGHVVHNIWCRKSKKLYVLTKAHKSYLQKPVDPLGLKDFYPCARPLMCNIQSGKFIPQPDFVFIETQHDNIQTLTHRINKLTAGIRDIGAYDSAVFEELATLSGARDGDYIPVNNLMERLGGADFRNVVASVDNTHKVNTLDRLRQQREDEKNIIYELQGIADIVRGATVASETATAQAIKDKHFQVRLSEKINELRRYWRDTYRIITEIIGEHFTEESFFVFSGVQIQPEQMQALMNDLGRAYMIDVETEDTTFEDDEKQRAQGIDLIRAIGEIMNMQQAVPPDLLVQLLTFGSNLFKQGAVLEDGIATLPTTQQQYEEFNQQLEQMGMENQQLMADLEATQQQLAEMQSQIQPIEQARQISEVRSKDAKTNRDNAEAEQTRVETAVGAI